MPTSNALSPAGWVRAWLLLAGSSGVVLCAQFMRPLTGAALLPRPINAACFALLLSAWGYQFRRGSRTHRAGVVACVCCSAYLVACTDGFRQMDSAHLASALSAELSRVVLFLPLPGLLTGWTFLLSCWLLREAILQALPEKPRSINAGVTAGVVLLAGFGTRAIIGYATGSPHLLP